MTDAPHPTADADVLELARQDLVDTERARVADEPVTQPSAPPSASTRVDAATPTPDEVAATLGDIGVLGIAALLEDAYERLAKASSAVRGLPGDHIMLLVDVNKARSLVDFCIRRVQSELM